ncbi:MAG: phosphoenolpyruvate kinase [Acidobacteriia bacterium]|nr:phosphoenolpyruvate kinase [Terriglobia bacterium]
MADTSIPDLALTTILDALHGVNVHVARQYPGDTAARQPVHTVYGGAHLFKADVARKLGAAALKSLRDHAPDAATLAAALNFDRALAERLYPRVVDKLTREPVEDFRIDFEDGFGSRPDLEEDGHAQLAATEVANGLSDGTLPPSIGIRIKPFNEELKRRSLRTFDLFLTRLLDRAAGKLPPQFVITLPKITSVEQVTALTSACEAFEYWRQLPAGTLKFELMVETTQSIVAPDGSVALPRLIAAGRGRIVAAHFGTYDYTASCGITAAHQHMRHPACDFAKDVMQVTLAGTGLWLSDGATNVMPVGSRETVHAAWRLHAEHIRHSLVTGFYQGWDLHPAQLPSRYAAVYAFFLEGLDAASERLKNFVQKAAQATLVGDVFDDAATGQGLLNYFLRAMNCGAITEEEAVSMSGLSLEELRGRSFVKILQGRS